MGKRDSTPPPRDNSLPDYIAGKLVYKDVNSDDNMRYVVYDGRTRIRFMTWHQAVSWCVHQAYDYDNEFVYNATTVYHKLLTTGNHLEKLAGQSRPEDKILLEQLSVNVRKIADYLDTFISQIVKAKEYEKDEANQG